MFYITISNGLLKDGHRKRIGSALWEFMWLIDKVTKIDNNGMGWVLGGKPIKLSDIADGVDDDTVSRNLIKLEEEGYIKKIRTPHGVSIRVVKAQKIFNKKPLNNEEDDYDPAIIQRKMSDDRKGEKHYNWKGGITPENKMIRNSLEYKNWRSEVFERDNWTCQECKNVGGKLEADHIKLFSTHKDLRLDLDNGRTLCKDCHTIKTKTDTAEMRNVLDSTKMRYLPEKMRYVIKTITVDSNRIDKREAQAPTPKEQAESFFRGIEDLMGKKEVPWLSELLCNIATRNNIPKRVVWDEVRNFGMYWTEKNTTGKTEKWQAQKFFEIQRRLATWFRRVGHKSFSSGGSKGKGIISSVSGEN